MLLLVCGINFGNAAGGGIHFPIPAGCWWCESLSQHSLVGNVLVKSFGTGKVRIVRGGVFEIHLIVSNTCL